MGWSRAHDGAPGAASAAHGQGVGTAPAWPPLPAPLRRRLSLDGKAFAAHTAELARRIGTRSYSEDTLRRAVRYPFASLPFPFVMAGASPWPLLSYSGADVANCQILFRGAARALEAVVAVRDAGPRWPLVCYGANASLDGLARKLRHAAGPDRITPVLTGALHGYDVGPSAHLSALGAMPATLFRSEGVSCRVAVAWVTAWQLERIVETEVNYRFGWLSDLPFTPDIDAGPLAGAYAFVSRHGALTGASGPLRLEAIAAEGRPVAPISQRAVLDQAARIVVGSGASASDLVRRTTEDYLWAVTDAVAELRSRAVMPFDGSWHEHPR